MEKVLYFDLAADFTARFIGNGLTIIGIKIFAKSKFMCEFVQMPFQGQDRLF